MRGRASASPPPPVATRSSATRTVQALHPMSERGAQIRNDMEAMMDDQFSGPAKGAQQGPASGDVRAVRGGVTSAQSSSYAKPATTFFTAPDGYYRGPKDTNGRLFNASDRNLLCMDVLGSLCVVGSADHGLKVFDINTMKEKRNLYNKKFGHTEWVTGCAFLPDGRIVSGGMDSKLCLWHASALRCDDLLGHTGSISQVDVNKDLAISASYDRTLKVWDCNRKTCVTTLAGHGGPVMTFAWCDAMIVSGDRKGALKMWDLETSACIGNFETKGGQVGALGHLLSETMGHLTYVGDQSGTLTVFDIRRTGTQPVFREVLHPGGVVGLAEGIPCMDMIVTAGADKRMLCLDTRMDLAAIHEWKDHKDFIYSLKMVGNIVLSGAGNGWVLVHDAAEGKCLYGLGANKAAVRSIVPTENALVCSGDDGTAIVYDM